MLSWLVTFQVKDITNRLQHSPVGVSGKLCAFAQYTIVDVCYKSPQLAAIYVKAKLTGVVGTPASWHIQIDSVAQQLQHLL